MKILITTQAVDENDPILGFFCRWLNEFAKHFEQIEVICLKEGKHDLPGNVHVHSLGKVGSGQSAVGSKFVYAFRFKMLAWKLRKKYDTVFVHMNPEYVIIGGLLWKLFGKKITFWYNHPNKDWRFKIAAWFADTIFYTSPYAVPAHYAKAKQMPVGIDTELFKPQPVPRRPHSIYMQGRIMSSKRVEILLRALRIVREKIPATAILVGPENIIYGDSLRTDFADLVSSGAVSFLGIKKNTETPELFSSHFVSINLAASGHFDKSVFESMACETPVIVSSRAFRGLVPDEWIVAESDPKALATAIEKMLALTESEYRALGEALRTAVVQEHSLSALAATLAQALSPSYHSRT